jgi:hypothetical protein
MFVQSVRLTHQPLRAVPIYCSPDVPPYGEADFYSWARRVTLKRIQYNQASKIGFFDLLARAEHALKWLPATKNLGLFKSKWHTGYPFALMSARR